MPPLDPESIADHSHRTAVIASAVAAMEGADPQRAAFLALFHDSQVTGDQTAALPGPLADVVGSAVAEYEARDSAESVCARDADKLECLLQAVEYREQGNRHTQAWVDTSLASLKTASAKRLAEEALRRGPLAWMHRAREEKPEL
ncbi:HD domain-containing protein [Streptomyces monashensis]|nr:HD domain-containing protein [Streptomyces monashensis]